MQDKRHDKDPDYVEKTHFFDKPENVNKFLKVFYFICLLLFMLDFVLQRHTYLDWEKLPGFYAIFGFVGCVLLVLIASGIRKILMRKEDYYDVDE